MKYDFESTLDRPGHDAIRLNLALPTRRVREALRRMERYILNDRKTKNGIFYFKFKIIEFLLHLC